jgi:hypothetical protein
VNIQFDAARQNEEKTMNVAEKLATEIMRVTELRERYRALLGQPNVNVKPAILIMMDRALAVACVAAGIPDAITQLNALKELEGFTE